MVQQPQSTMVIPVLDELVSMNLPLVGVGDPVGGGGLEHYGKVVLGTY